MSASRSGRRASAPLLAVVVAGATILVLVGCRPVASSSSGEGGLGGGLGHGRVPTRAHLRDGRGGPGELPRAHRGAATDRSGLADGEVPDGVTVFSDAYPGVTRLQPALLAALRTAATAALGDGITIDVDSGWRSRSYQAQLFGEAVATYGSTQEAARWVAPPGRSSHEVGEAVDVGPHDAATWLAEHGATYGLCQIYANEPWHYERRPQAATQGCPAPYADPTHDPRMLP